MDLQLLELGCAGIVGVDVGGIELEVEEAASFSEEDLVSVDIDVGHVVCKDQCRSDDLVPQGEDEGVPQLENWLVLLCNLLLLELPYEGGWLGREGRNCLEDGVSHVLKGDCPAVENYHRLVLLPELLGGIPAGLVGVLTLESQGCDVTLVLKIS